MGKIFFASDFHLTPTSKDRENRVIRWLNAISGEAEAIYLVGDLFDFWFEYTTVVPRGYVRFLGKLAELRDAGVPIHIFTGNHDMWMFRYFETELGIAVHRQPLMMESKGKRFFIGHGDGLGPGDVGYKILKRVFRNPLCQWLFGRLHPDLGIRLAERSSGASRHYRPPEAFSGKENEWLYLYSNRKLERESPCDYYIFGHRHLPLDIKLNNKKSRYINLGEWLNYNSYAVFDGENLTVQFFENEAYAKVFQAMD